MVLTQGGQFLGIKVAPAGQRRIEHRAGVAVREDKAVPVRPVGILRINVHHMKIQCGDHLHGGQRASGMSGFSGVDHRDDILADLYRLFLQTFHILLSEIVVVHQDHSFLIHLVAPGASAPERCGLYFLAV